MRLWQLLVITLLLFGGCTFFNSGNDQKGKPEANRFTSKVLVDGLDEPMQLEFDQEHNVYWVERTGSIKRLNEPTGRVDEIASLPVHHRPGLIGILLGRNFRKTGHIYIYYSAAEDSGDVVRLSRFTLGKDDKLNKESEVVVLRVPWEQPSGSHMGGGMTWDFEGNLYLSVGGDTAPTKYAPMEFANENGRGQDAARTAANTNDLRGKILRIHPQADGSYTIPEGNLFPPETPDSRPEIYVMGNRNPWRLSVDSQTGYLHWGEVGPDAGVDSSGLGPMGYDEFNVAKDAGNYGWPFVIGYNQAYNRYDYTSKTYKGRFDVSAPANTSPNNTGMRKLPPAKPALLSYPYGVSEEWPLLSSGARSAVGGPIFRRTDFSQDAPRVFPEYYEGKWLITDYVRNWIMVLTMNEDRSEVLSIEPLLPNKVLSHSQPLDMDFGPTGDLYLVEYGRNSTGRISKIMYNAGNRAPIAQAGADKLTGATPLQVQLSSKKTVDFDGDDLEHEWVVTSRDGGEVQRFAEANPIVTFEKPGKYQVKLMVSDPDGETGSDTLTITAGNEQPEVNLQVTQGNRSFYFPGSTVSYKVQVSDPEDGSLESGNIKPDAVAMTAEYVPSGLTPDQLNTMIEEGQVQPETSLRFVQAQSLITENNCSTCHKLSTRLVGPAFKAVAEKRMKTGQSVDSLAQKILQGGSGVWGNTPMPPQSQLSKAEARQIAEYIMNLGKAESGLQELDIKGQLKMKVYKSSGQNGRLAGFFELPYERGAYVLRTSYTDEGIDEAQGLELTGEDYIVLRYPLFAPEEADIISEGITYTPSTNDPGFIINGPGGHIGFKDIDLTGIGTINIGAITRFWHWTHFIGGTVEVRLDSPTGRLVGKPYERIVPPTGSSDGPFFGDDLERPIPVDVSAINGTHDLFIVVHNSNAENDDALLIMTGIEFKQ